MTRTQALALIGEPVRISRRRGHGRNVNTGRLLALSGKRSAVVKPRGHKQPEVVALAQLLPWRGGMNKTRGGKVADDRYTIHVGDAIEVLAGMPPGSANCCVTSPPYFRLRDYGCDGQMGLEPTPDEYVAAMVGVFREVRRVLRDDGTLWLNIGDSYSATGKSGGGRQGKRWESAGAKTAGPRGGAWSPPPPGFRPKELLGIPWRLAFALQADGWLLRQDIIWHKPSPMPESVKDRCTKAHEYVFLLAKSPRYYFDYEAIQEPAKNPGSRTDYTGEQKNNAADQVLQRTRPRGRVLRGGSTRRKRGVWTIASSGYKGAHFAVMPEGLAEPCTLAGCPEGGVVLDPFAGAGTTGLVALRHGRRFQGIELNPESADLARQRIDAEHGGGLHA